MSAADLARAFKAASPERRLAMLQQCVHEGYTRQAAGERLGVGDAIYAAASVLGLNFPHANACRRGRPP